MIYERNCHRFEFRMKSLVNKRELNYRFRSKCLFGIRKWKQLTNIHCVEAVPIHGPSGRCQRPDFEAIKQTITNFHWNFVKGSPGLPTGQHLQYNRHHHLNESPRMAVTCSTRIPFTSVRISWQATINHRHRPHCRQQLHFCIVFAMPDHSTGSQTFRQSALETHTFVFVGRSILVIFFCLSHFSLLFKPIMPLWLLPFRWLLFAVGDSFWWEFFHRFSGIVVVHCALDYRLNCLLIWKRFAQAISFSSPFDDAKRSRLTGFRLECHQLRTFKGNRVEISVKWTLWMGHGR